MVIVLPWAGNNVTTWLVILLPLDGNLVVICFFQKKNIKKFVGIKKNLTFATAFREMLLM